MYCEPHEFPTPTKPTPAQRKKLDLLFETIKAKKEAKGRPIDHLRAEFDDRPPSTYLFLLEPPSTIEGVADLFV